MNSIPKNVYINKLDIVHKYNKTCHRAIKMKPFDVKSNTYLDFNKENSKEGSKFEVRNHVRISKYKNIFAKDNVPNQPEKGFVIKKVKNTLPWTFVISDFNGEEIVGTLYEKQMEKTNQKNLELKK